MASWLYRHEPGVFRHGRPAHCVAGSLRTCAVRRGLLGFLPAPDGHREDEAGTGGYLVARWGAYPVVWCLAGEAAMPYYLSEDPQKERAEQIEGWTELARYVRKIDPYRRLVTIHPTDRGREQVTDPTVLDFEMLQTGHSGAIHVSNTFKQVLHAYPREPVMPVLVGEVNYEGILHGTRDDTQRVCFWSSVLSGCAGHTYGANGIWQLDTPEKLFGPSPHGATWGDTPWQEAYRLPGSSHVGIGKRLLERFEWWRFEPHQEWVDPAGSAEDYNRPFAAGIRDKSG